MKKSKWRNDSPKMPAHQGLKSLICEKCFFAVVRFAQQNLQQKIR
jgi:hypothetical protein